MKTTIEESGQPAVPKRARRLTGLAAAMLVAVSGVALAASPAQAATPSCTQSASFQNGQATVFAPADANWNWRCTMRYGTGSWSTPTSWHWGVFRLQEDINVCYKDVIGGYWPLSTDGDFGGNTRGALVRVQQHLRIGADGVYGPQTAAAMSHWAWAQTPYGYFYFCGRLP